MRYGLCHCRTVKMLLSFSIFVGAQFYVLRAQSTQYNEFIAATFG